MYIESGDGKRIAEPDSQAIAQVISALGDEPNHYAILARAEEEYVQAMVDEGGQFLMEYRDGDEEKHFITTREDLTRDEVIRVFHAYGRGAKDWNAALEWRRLKAEEMGGGRGCGRPAAMLLAAVTVILLLIARAVWAN